MLSRLRTFWNKGHIVRLLKDTSGTTIVYVTILASVLIGFAGMAVDFGRLFTTHSQAQAAADAIALTAASQLDGRADAITRATNAAITSPLISNSQTYGEGADPSGTMVFELVNIRFLSDLPASDDDPITAAFETVLGSEARFVEVTTEELLHTNLFLVSVGADETATTSAIAVAGFTQVLCRITPLMICNPNEAPPPDGEGLGASFPIDDWRGRQILAKQQGGPGSTWTPGNFGLLDVPDGDQGAKAMAEMLASASGPNACFSSEVDLAPGSKAAVRTAFNTRFDIYENPFFGGNQQSDPDFRPARNVIKGRIPDPAAAPGTDVCDKSGYIEPGPLAAAKLGRDSNISDAAFHDVPRFGNGQWDCAEYWSVNHPFDPAPAGCSAPDTVSISRYDIYRLEIDTGLIPDGTGGPEDGFPQCYTGDAAAIGDNPDRRILYLAVVNCIDDGVLNGNESDVPVVNFITVFLTEPTGDESAGGTNDGDVFFEIVDVVKPGADDGVLHDIVQLYR